MLGIKKIYAFIKSFLTRHYRFAEIILFAVMITGCISAIYLAGNLLIFIYFATSIATIFRLSTYKHGKLPIFMFDKTWDSYKLKYSEDEFEDKYKEMSANRATVYFIITIIVFIIWILFAILTYSTEMI